MVAVPHTDPALWTHGWDLDSASASYLRIAAISIAAYDYLQTLPAEWRYYKVQRSWRVSPGCMLFILIRYISFVTVTVSAIGYFGSFSSEDCARWYMTTPVFKVLQILVSQIIMGVRTVNIARRTPWVVWMLIVAFLIAAVLEFFTNLYDRNYVQDKRHNCTGGSDYTHLSVWLFYVVAMCYDFLTVVISTFFLMSYTPTDGRMSRLVRIMLYDGIGYFVMLTAVNILNLILYRTSDEMTQSSGACLSFAVVWIMSQKILLHLRDAASENNRTTTGTQVITVSRPLHSAQAVSAAMRSQFETKSKNQLDDTFSPRMHTLTASDLQLGTSSRTRDSEGGLAETHMDVEVEVAVEANVTVEYARTVDTYERERHAYRENTGRGVW